MKYDFFFITYHIFSLVPAPQSFDPQDRRADVDAELQDRQDDQHAIDASQENLVGSKKTRWSLFNFNIFVYMYIHFIISKNRERCSSNFSRVQSDVLKCLVLSDQQSTTKNVQFIKAEHYLVRI